MSFTTASRPPSSILVGLRRPMGWPSDLGLPHTGPTAIVHFSAVWCGPCAGVRWSTQVCGDLPSRACRNRYGRQSQRWYRRLSVLSLPTIVHSTLPAGNDSRNLRRLKVTSISDLRLNLCWHNVWLLAAEYWVVCQTCPPALSFSLTKRRARSAPRCGLHLLL